MKKQVKQVDGRKLSERDENKDIEHQNNNKLWRGQNLSFVKRQQEKYQNDETFFPFWDLRQWYGIKRNL
jgi:hypothetical protein